MATELPIVRSGYSVSPVFIQPRGSDRWALMTYPGASYLVHITGEATVAASSLAEAKTTATAAYLAKCPDAAGKVVWTPVHERSGARMTSVRTWVPKAALAEYLAANAAD